MSRKLRYYSAIFAALVHAVFSGYGFWSFNNTGNFFLDVLIATGGILLGTVTFYGMGEYWNIFEKQEENEWFEAEVEWK